MKPRQWTLVCAALMLAPILVGRQANAETARVIDESTGKPLAGVFVVTQWTADTFNPVQSSHTCFKVDATHTDDRGKFYLSSWSGNLSPMLSNRQRLPFLFYLSGFRSVEGEDRNDNLYKLVRDERGGIERLDYINQVIYRARFCGEQQASHVLL